MHTFPKPLPEDVQRKIDGAWTLEPQTTFLNHGSFGATPKSVLRYQHELRARIETQPVRFFMGALFGLYDKARGVLAEFVGADTEDIVFVQNATSGVNTVLRSLRFEPGDELLTTNHDYKACRQTLEFVARRAGAKVVVAEVPFPISDPAQVVQALEDKVTERTKLALLDHVTSSTGLVFPIQQMVDAMKKHGVETLVDGAHAAGMVEVDLKALRPTYYTTNCHKWICGPKSAALLYVDRARHDDIHPLTISYGSTISIRGKSTFHKAFDWVGTHDPTPALAAARAITEMDKLLPGGWPKIRQHNRAKVLAGRDLLAKTLGVEAPAPDAMIGSISALRLPDEPLRQGEGYFPSDKLYEALKEERIEVPVFFWPRDPQRLIRISAQLYNSEADYLRLADALKTHLKLS